MDVSLPFVAGGISTIIYAFSVLPMVVKAGRTKDLSSYSFGNILLANVGNGVHSIYVFTLPMGPLWLLHSFYVVTTGLMLVWYLHFAPHRKGTVAADPPTSGYTEIPTSAVATNVGSFPDAVNPAALLPS